ncbi:hypothetical protein [Pseudolysinimonas sp.]|jgi:hypothetical protein|uniref:hypothetical protein n=1 Tax=Pseudolysinimonas sp. TaxID=2680009 RepID=UPI00378442D9
MRTRLVLTTGLAALSLLALAACASPGAIGEGTAAGTGAEAEGSSGGSGGLAGCLVGTWEADTADLAAQLQTFFNDNGSPVTSVAEEGSSTLEVSSDTMTYDVDLTFTAVADSDGLEMVIVQDHVGTSSGAWAVEGDEVVFSEWTNGITITNAITIGGTSTGEPTELPADTGAGVPMAVECEGDTMVTSPDESPFTTTWIRVG